MAGCVSTPPDTQMQVWTPPPEAATPVPTPMASPSSAMSPVAARTANPSVTAGTPTTPPVTVSVSPASVQTGGVTLSLALEPARRMIADTAAQTSDQASTSPPSATPPSASPPETGDPKQAALTALTLDGLLKVTNNLDPSQPAPPDEAQSILRHLNLQIRSNDGGYPVPYLTVSMDILLDGRPMLAGLSAVPMTAPDSATPQLLYYGNNLKLTQRGTYQIFVRMQPTSVLGKEPPPTAEFNVIMR